MWAWGHGYRNKNRFQEYYIAIVRSVENEDWMYFNQLRDELTRKQWLDIWSRLASYTRRQIKENEK